MGEVCKPLFKKSCILGLGLMGGSLGMALGRYGIVQERWGNDLNVKAMEEAEKRKAVEHVAKLEPALEGADLVVLCLPVKETGRMLARIAPFLKTGALVTDVGSTKREVVLEMEKNLPPGIMFVGGHPMAGSERAGIMAADPFLFENAIYVLTPTSRTPQKALDLVTKMVLGIKAHPLMLDPDEHDRLVPFVSHLPHLVAVALVNTVKNCKDKNELFTMLAGGGFRDTTRIAMGEPSLWYDIFSSNKKYLRQSLKAFLKQLVLLITCLEEENREEASRIMEEAQVYRRLFSSATSQDSGAGVD